MTWNRNSASAPNSFDDKTNYNANNSIYHPYPTLSDSSSLPTAQYSMPAMPLEYMNREFSNESAGSTTLYETEPIPTYESVQPPSRMTEMSYSSRATPSTLGWSPKSNFLHAYKFVVPKGSVPYFELLDGHTATSNIPEKVFLDPPNNSNKNEFPCQYFGCDQKVFRRAADLDRHYIKVHGGPDQKDTLSCDYGPCKTDRRTFTRKDHFRDHLRDYHKEDIGTFKSMNKEIDKKSQEWLKLQETWIADRRISSTWWRCPKCLQRVQIAKFGYDCQSCKHPCDKQRADRIEGLRQNSAASHPSSSTIMEDVQHDTVLNYPANCLFCGNTGWISNELAGASWDACTECQPSMEQCYMFNDSWDDGATGDAYYSRY